MDPTKRFILTGLAVAACLAAGCTVPTGHPQTGIRKLIFIDQSLSARGAREWWLNAALDVIRALGPGDAVKILAVHGRTAEAPPLYEAEIPALRAHPTSRQLADYVDAKARVVTEASSALRKAFAAESNAASTDVFSIVDRAQVGTDRRPEKVWIFSDMLNSTENLDIEHKRLPEARTGELIAAATRLHEWKPDTLRGATFFVVLPEGKSPLNDRRVLQKLYSSLIAGLGGNLARFDFNLESEDLK